MTVSTCTVAVLPEVDEVEAEEIKPADLRVGTYLASGIVVECQDA